MNILVVDDDDSIALALKAILRRQFPEAEIVTLSDGLQAYEFYKNNNVGLILSDWNMPEMTGKELLSNIRLRNKDTSTPFLMLTARVDAGSVRAAISTGVTEYIAKPFEKKALLDKVSSLLEDKLAEKALDTAGNSVSGDIEKRIIELIRIRLKKDYIGFPVLPEVAFKAVKIINSDKVSMTDVADVVKIDTALSGQILSLANSTHYRAQQPLETLEEAMARVGVRETMRVVLVYAMKELFKDNDKQYGKHLRQLWENALMTALMARSLANRLGFDKADKYYTLGMFYDIGKLMILPVLMELKKARPGITDEMVTEVMQALNKEVGMALLKHWGFSDLFMDVIETRCEFSDLANAGDENLLMIVVSYLCHQLAGDSTDLFDDNIISMIKNQLKIDSEMVLEVNKDAKKVGKMLKESLTA